MAVEKATEGVRVDRFGDGGLAEELLVRILAQHASPFVTCFAFVGRTHTCLFTPVRLRSSSVLTMSSKT
jgi:hypothetical protein